MKIKYLRIPAFILAVTVFISLFFGYFSESNLKSKYPIVANAVTYVGKCGDDSKWTLNLKTGTLTIDGKGTTYNYEDGKTPWYKYRDEIEKINISQGVDSIGDYMLSHLRKVRSINLPSSVKTIGENAFLGCSYLRKVEATSTSKLKSIGENAFAYCRKLEEIPSFSHLKYIGKNAFFYCYSLNNVVLGYSVEIIGEGAFDCCQQLEKARIVNFNADIFDSSTTFGRNTCIESFTDSTAKKYADKYSNKFSVIKDINYLNDLDAKLEYSNTSYNGNKKTPSVSIKGLKQGVDFTLKYSDNKEPGIAKVSVKAAGETLGSKTLSFKINPSKVKSIKLVERTSSSISFKWSKTFGAEKYEVYTLEKGEWRKIASVTECKYTADGLSAGKSVSFKVRAVLGSKDKKCSGKFSDVFTEFTRPSSPSIEKVSLVRGGGKLRVTVGSFNGAAGCEIFMSTKEHGKYEKVAVIQNGKNKSVTIDNLSNSEVYYFKARSFIKNGDAQVYSTYSEIVSSNVL